MAKSKKRKSEHILRELRAAEIEALKISIADDVRTKVKKWAWRPVGAVITVLTLFGLTSIPGLRTLQNQMLETASKDFTDKIQTLYDEQNVSSVVECFVRRDAEQIIRAQVSEQAEWIEQTYIQPLTSQANALSSNVSDLSNSVASATHEFTELEHDLNDMSDDILALRHFFNARRGDRESYAGLVKSARQDNAGLASALLQDVNEHYRDFKNETFGTPAGQWGRSIVHIKTLKYFKTSPENIYRQIFSHQDPYQRRAEVNETARRDMKYFVEELITVVTNDPNIFVSSRAVSAIESLTGTKFSDIPPFDDVIDWWQTEGHTNASYASPFKLLAQAENAVRGFRLDEALALYKQATSNFPNLSYSYYSMGLIQELKGDIDAAQSSYKSAIEGSDGFYLAVFKYAGILSKQGKHGEAVQELQKVKPYFIGDFIAEIKARSDLKALQNFPSFKMLSEKD